MGASNTGGRSTASPGSASRKPLTQSISGNRRMTCRKASAMPMASTAMINALSPGLARKAAQICLYSTITTSAHSVRNTTIRTRKIRGDESLNGSMSCAMVMGSAPPSSPDNKARTRRKEEPRPPPGAEPRRQRRRSPPYGHRRASRTRRRASVRPDIMVCRLAASLMGLAWLGLARFRGASGTGVWTQACREPLGLTPAWAKPSTSSCGRPSAYAAARGGCPRWPRGCRRS